MALYERATVAEDALNNTLTKVLKMEHNFTSTIRSLAPPKESGEKLFPGALYVLVSSMAGSILTRNRNIVLRATVPAAIGVGAAYAILPITMRNVGDLAWTYERRYPAIAEAHLNTRARIEHFWETGKAHTRMSVAMVQEKVQDTRETLEDWVKKGR
jgi:organizing structure protein 2